MQQHDDEIQQKQKKEQQIKTEKSIQLEAKLHALIAQRESLQNE